MFCTKKQSMWMVVVYIILSLELCFHTVAAGHEHEHITLQKDDGIQAHHPYNITLHHTSPYGIVYEEDPSPPLMYDTFYTIIFDAAIPVWNSTDLRVILPQEFSNVSKFCNDTSAETDLWGASVCPIMNKLNEMLDDFYVQLKMIESHNTSTTTGKHHFTSCHQIKSHFSSQIVDDEAMTVYLLKSLMECPLKDIVHRSLNVSYVNQTKYTELLKNFFDIYINPRYRMGGYVKYAASTNILISIHATELFEHFMFAYQWSASMATCNSQRIPDLLVSEEMLKETLLEVQTKAQAEGLELTIPIDDLSSYYKLALADCVTGNIGKSYVIRVLVPLTKILANYKLVNFRSVPYLNKENEDVPLICEHHIKFRSLVIQGNTHMPVAVPKCDDAKNLCQVPPVGDRPFFDRCVLDVLFNRSATIIDHCDPTCVKIEESLLPFIQRIKSDQFVIVGKSSAEIAIMCGSDTKPLKVLEVPDHVGSLMVTVPCGCSIVHRTDKYYIEGECGLKLDIVPVKAIGLEDVLLHYSIKINKTAKGNEARQLNKEEISKQKEENEVFSNSYENLVSEATGKVATWPMHWAFVLSIICIFCLVLAFAVGRNMYIRLGQLELSFARQDRPSTEFHNMSFNVRAAAENDSVY
ncbi:unnamed protein product [Orchesella dallaii]|uniref:Uncharacterized protein n=1 Tax=Orchesella dallaii TaxID=48710 RepID=A0ABP1Q2D7_9HEXA